MALEQRMEIKRNEALGDAEEIRKMVSDLKHKTEELNNIMNTIVNSELSLDWADDALNAWQTRSMENIEESFASMETGANSIVHSILTELEHYSRGKNTE